MTSGSEAEPRGEHWMDVLQGDGQAFAEIFDIHGDRVYRHARRLVVSRADAEDITAMTFVEAWRSLAWACSCAVISRRRFSSLSRT